MEHYIGIFLLGFTTFASGMLVFIFPKLSAANFTYLLAFAGSFLFSTMLVHLIPELFIDAHEKDYAAATYFLAGFFVQFLLDMLGGSIAHGHTIHTPKHTMHRSSISLVLALCFHAFIEGFVLTGKSIDVWVGIILHKLPAAFTLATLLYQSKKSNLSILISITLFALASPIGYFIHQYLIDKAIIKVQHLMYINALAIGTLFHIATVMLFESQPNHKFSPNKMMCVALGTVVAIFSHQHMH